MVNGEWMNRRRARRRVLRIFPRSLPMSISHRRTSSFGSSHTGKHITPMITLTLTSLHYSFKISVFLLIFFDFIWFFIWFFLIGAFFLSFFLFIDSSYFLQCERDPRKDPILQHCCGIVEYHPPEHCRGDCERNRTQNGEQPQKWTLLSHKATGTLFSWNWNGYGNRKWEWFILFLFLFFLWLGSLLWWTGQCQCAWTFRFLGFAEQIHGWDERAQYSPREIWYVCIRRSLRTALGEWTLFEILKKFPSLKKKKERKRTKELKISLTLSFSVPKFWTTRNQRSLNSSSRTLTFIWFTARRKTLTSWISSVGTRLWIPKK